MITQYFIYTKQPKLIVQSNYGDNISFTSNDLFTQQEITDILKLNAVAVFKIKYKKWN